MANAGGVCMLEGKFCFPRIRMYMTTTCQCIAVCNQQPIVATLSITFTSMLLTATNQDIVFALKTQHKHGSFNASPRTQGTNLDVSQAQYISIVIESLISHHNYVFAILVNAHMVQ